MFVSQKLDSTLITELLFKSILFGDLDQWVFSVWQRRLWRPCQLRLPLTLRRWSHPYLHCMPSSFKIFYWSLRQSASSPLVSATRTSLPRLFVCSPPFRFSLCPLLHVSFFLNFSGTCGKNCHCSPPLLSGYNGSPDTHFFRETTRSMSWPGEVRYSRLLQSHVVPSFDLSYLLFLISRLEPYCLI